VSGIAGHGKGGIFTFVGCLFSQRFDFSKLLIVILRNEFGDHVRPCAVFLCILQRVSSSSISHRWLPPLLCIPPVVFRLSGLIDNSRDTGLLLPQTHIQSEELLSTNIGSPIQESSKHHDTLKHMGDKKQIILCNVCLWYL
jgi:hypothetical protein